MRQIDCDVAVIGAGTAGLQTYKAATARGAHAVMVERGPGGSTCTRAGCMPSKLLIAAGRAAARVRDADLFGIRAGEMRIDGAAVMARVRAERDRFVPSVLDEYHAIPDDRRVQGEARFTGPTTLAVGDDVTITAKAVVIAAGSYASVPDALKPVAALVRTNDDIFDLPEPPRSLAVIGAGPLGIELAQAFARLGVAVTVLDEGRTVGHLSDPEAERAAKVALGRSFDLHLSVKVEARLAEDGRAAVSWTGAGTGSVTVDLVLVAAGRPPNLAALNLAATGLDCDEHGVPRFDHRSRRCGDAPVFIAGDAGSWRPVLHEASRGGRIAGSVAAGGEPPRALPALSIAFTEPNLVEVGRRFDALPEGAVVGTAAVDDNGRATIDGREDGVVRLYADREGVLIGATVVAPDGEHLGHLVALAIDRGMHAAEFADQPWYHPTLEELLPDAVQDLIAKLP